MKQSVRFFVGAAFLWGTLSSCTHGNQKEEARLELFPVRVMPLAPRDLEETLTLVGSLKAKDEATLFSRVPGKLLKNLVREGDRVGRGDAVALVERDEVGVKFEPAPIPSTLTGVVARVYLDQGANVTLTTPVALVVDQRRVFAQAEIPERYAGRVSVGQEVRAAVDAHPDKLFRGKVSRLSPVVNTTTRTAYMEASLDNSAGLLQSGMFSKLTLILAQRKKVLAVPVNAFGEGTQTLFVAENGRAKRRDVELGLRTNEYVEIRKGLSEGDQVITFGLYGLKDGSSVEVLP